MARRGARHVPGDVRATILVNGAEMADVDSGAQSGSDQTVMCRCEEIGASEIVAAIAAGAVSLNDVKRRTRAGMGACQGLYCMPAIAALVAGGAGVAVETLAPMTVRPPVRPIGLAALADLSIDVEAEA